MKLIILDRDGVINHDSDAFIKSPEEWVPIDGSLEAIAQLHQAGWRIVVATNQSGIARGLFSIQTLNAIHAKMLRLARNAGGEIDAVFFCPHAGDDHCDCRKPRPGMFHDIARRYETPLNVGVPVVGDALRDLQAGFISGCAPHLVRTGKGQKTETEGGLPPGTRIHANLAEVVQVLLSNSED